MSVTASFEANSDDADGHLRRTVSKNTQQRETLNQTKVRHLGKSCPSAPVEPAAAPATMDIADMADLQVSRESHG